MINTQKSGLSFENGPLFKSCVTLRKLPQNGSYLEKWVTLRQMIQIRRSDSHSQNWVPLGRQSRLWKNGLQLKNESYLENGSLLDEWVTLGKMGYIGKIKSHFDEWVTLEQVGHIWKNRSHLDWWVTLGKLVHTFQKCFTLGKMGHPGKTESHLEKMGHT